MGDTDLERARLLPLGENGANLERGIQLSGVVKTFGDHTILHGIDLHVDRGTIYGASTAADVFVSFRSC